MQEKKQVFVVGQSNIELMLFSELVPLIKKLSHCSRQKFKTLVNTNEALALM